MKERTSIPHKRAKGDVRPDGSASPAWSRRSFLGAIGGAALLGFSPFLAGCSSNKNVVYDKGETVRTPDVHLTFFGYKYEALNVAAIEDILRDFMDEYPDVNVSYEGIKGSSYYDSLDKRLETGNGNDVFMVDHDRALRYGGQGYLADLSSLSTIPSFSPFALSQMQSEGAVDYVPTSISAFGLFCNEALLADAGLEPPKTWPEFERACDAFRARGVVPVVANNDISLKTWAIARGMASVYTTPGTPLSRIKELNEDPEALAGQLREGFESVAVLVERGYVDAALALETVKNSDDLGQFATGGYPFMLAGAWNSVRVRDMAPDLEYTVHPYPVLDDGSVLVVNVDTRVSANACGSHLEETFAFLEFFTQPKAINAFAWSQCSFSPLEGNAAPEDETVAPLVEAFEAGSVVIGSDDNLAYPIWEATRQCAVALLEGSAPAEAERLLVSLIGERKEGDGQ